MDSRYWWLNLASQEAEIRRISSGKQFKKHYFKKTLHQKGLMEWLKV
jgi:hypothetical protein